MGTETGRWVLCSLVAVVADALDIVLSALASKGRPQPDFLHSDIDLLTEDEIFELEKKAPELLSDYNVLQLTPNTVAKTSQDIELIAPDASEANAHDLMFAKTTVPVPRVRRVVCRKWDYLMVMDYTKGAALADVWSTFSLWRKMRVGFTLHRYVRQLRRLKAPLDGKRQGTMGSSTRPLASTKRQHYLVYLQGRLDPTVTSELHLDR